MDMVLDSGQAEAETFAYLLVGKILHIAQKKDLPASRRKFRNGPVDHRTDIAAVQDAEHLASVHIIG